MLQADVKDKKRRNNQSSGKIVGKAQELSQRFVKTVRTGNMKLNICYL
jgi:hypothetical protein